MIPVTDFDGAPLNMRKIRKRARVTDHALLRYLERVMDLPIEQIRRQILTDGVVQAMALGAQSVRLQDHHVVLQGRVVVTILAPTMIVRRRRRKAHWPKASCQQKGQV